MIDVQALSDSLWHLGVARKTHRPSVWSPHMEQHENSDLEESSYSDGASSMSPSAHFGESFAYRGGDW